MTEAEPGAADPASTLNGRHAEAPSIVPATAGPASSASGRKRIATPAQREALSKARNARGRGQGAKATQSSQEIKKPRRTAPRAKGTAQAVTGEVIRMGRPPLVLDAQMKGTVVAILRQGASYKTACIVAGISTRAFEVWRQRASQYGEDDDPEDIPEIDRPYVEFVRQAIRAREEAVVAALNVIQMAGRGRKGKLRIVPDPDAKSGERTLEVETALAPNFQAMTWLLEHTHPEEFGKQWTVTAEQKDQVVREVVQKFDLALAAAGATREMRVDVGRFLLEQASDRGKQEAKA